MDNIIICPESPSSILKEMINSINKKNSYDIYYTNYSNLDLTNKRIIFALELGNGGINLNILSLLKSLKKNGPKALRNSYGGVIIHSNNEHYTRSVARDIIFACNSLGCSFLGKPLVEATGSLKNFINYKKFYHMSLKEACLKSCEELSNRLLNFKLNKLEDPKILILHSSNLDMSNTYMLWNLVKANLSSCDMKEIHIGNEKVIDCRGCSFKTCTYFGKQSSCYYGGIMVEEIYPSIIEANYLILLCPNYNDALTANMSAFINRLTALYRKTPFYDKLLYSIIVSGHSGSDILAKQLISGLNINKAFILPPYFALMETANYPKDILKVKDIEKKAKEFANNILN